MTGPPPDGGRSPIGEIAGLFLKLGATSFGGPAAHIAQMHEEIVVRRQWLTPQRFLDLVGATNLIPGPNSTELAIHVGYVRAGWRGLVVAGAAFIVPAALIVWVLAVLYVEFGARPDVRAVLAGVAPVVVAIVGIALGRLARTALQSVMQIAIALGAIVALVAGVHELLVLLCAGLLGAVGGGRVARMGCDPRTGVAIAASTAAGGTAVVATAAAVTTAVGAAGGAAGAVTLSGLFLVCAKAGAVLFGSGYVLFAFLRADLVERFGWLSETQLLDGIAIGQVTPGPLFTTATFIGYVLAGTPGAIVATAAIFLPAFAYVAMSGPIVPRLRRSRWAAGALDAVNAASLALMAVVGWQLGRAAIVSLPMVALAGAAAASILWWRINPSWLVLAGAFAGLAMGWR